MRVLFLLVGLVVFGCSGDAFVSADASGTDSSRQDVTVADTGLESGLVEAGSRFCSGPQPPNLVFCEDWDSSSSLPSAWNPQNSGATQWKIESALAISAPNSLHGTFDSSAAPADHAFVIHSASPLGLAMFTVEFDVRFDNVASGNEFSFLRVGTPAGDAGLPFYASASLNSGKIDLTTAINNQSTNASPQKDAVYHGSLSLIKAGTWQAKLEMAGNSVQLQVSASTPAMVQLSVGALGSVSLQGPTGVRIDNILVTSN